MQRIAVYLRVFMVLGLVSVGCVRLSMAQLPGGTGTNCTPSTSLQVSASAGPDVDAAQPGVQVRIGMIVQASGVARLVRVTVKCDVTETLVPLSWSLTFQPPGGAEIDVTSMLSPATSQSENSPSTTSFTAAQEGTYRVALRGSGPSGMTRTAVAQVLAVFPPPVLMGQCGKLNFLRGHDLGTGFGPPSDFIDVEVVAKFASDPPKAFGFQLRTDANGPTRSGMLDLLRDAFNNNWTVCLDYLLVPGKNNGVIIRVALTK